MTTEESTDPGRAWIPTVGFLTPFMRTAGRTYRVRAEDQVDGVLVARANYGQTAHASDQRSGAFLDEPPGAHGAAVGIAIELLDQGVPTLGPVWSGDELAIRVTLVQPLPLGRDFHGGDLSIELPDGSTQLIARSGVLNPSRDRAANAATSIPFQLATGAVTLATGIIALAGDHAEGKIVAAVGGLWHEILAELSRDPDFWRKLKPRQFEEFIAGAYKRAGYSEVVLTPQSHDRGRDIIATFPGVGAFKIYDDVKLISPDRNVAPEQVRAMLGILDRDRNVSKGVITTTGYFSNELQAEMSSYRPHRLELRDGLALRKWLKQLRGDG